MSVVRPRLHHHCPYQHYQMLHRDSGSDYGNSVFNYTYNFNGGNICGGGFWGGIWGGIGMGIGNLLGGLFGGLMGGCFGGGMMASPFSIYGNSTLFNPTNFWNIGNKDNADGAGGNEKAGKNRKAKETEKVKEDPEVKPEDKTTETENEKLKNEYDALLAKHDLTSKEAEDFLNKNKDKLNNNQIKALNERIAKLKEVEEAKNAQEAEALEEDNDIKKAKSYEYNKGIDIKEQTLLEGFSWVNGTDISKMELEEVVDFSGKTDKIKPLYGHTFSKEKFGNTNYPLYLAVRDNGGTYYYKCIKASEKTAVYATPTDDNNNNMYLVAIKNNKLVFFQPETISKENGYGKDDTQIKNRKADNEE